MIASLLLSRGRVMSPGIPHRALLGVADPPFDKVRPGEIIKCRGKGLPRLLRVIGFDGGRGTLLCLAEGSGRRFRVDREAYRGTVQWRCYKGDKKSLAVPAHSLSALTYLALAKGEARLPFLAPLRRWMSLSLGEPSGKHPEATEIPFLLREVRSVMEHSDTRSLEPPGGLDWDIYLELALSHAVHGMLTPGWRTLPPASAPAETVQHILSEEEKRTEKVWEDSQRILGLVLPALEADGISCILLKGPSMGPAYGERHLERWFGDLDLLVRPDRVERAMEILEGLGFRSKTEGSAHALIRKGHFHVVLRPPALYSLSIELHWELVDRGNFYRIDLDGVFDRSRIIDYRGLPMPVLSPEDEVSYLCLHLCKHGFLNGIALNPEVGVEWLGHGASGNRLIWFVDLARCLERKDMSLDPSLLWERACGWNAEEKVLECLLLLRELFAPECVKRFLDHAPADLVAAGRKNPSKASFWMGGQRRLRILRWSMTMHPLFAVRPVRMLELWGLFFPPRAQFLRLYGKESLLTRIWRRFTHPFSMARRLWH
jgi:hypothetical protein